jgi:hypothetical protein
MCTATDDRRRHVNYSALFLSEFQKVGKILLGAKKLTNTDDVDPKNFTEDPQKMRAYGANS